jgi:RimJ/RimL family protein N-acetyltransferase
MAPPAEPRPRVVSLRAAQGGDASLLARWRAEESVRRHQPLRDVTLPEIRAELAALRPSDLWRSTGERFQWIVLADRDPVGWITLQVVTWDHGLAEMGYALTTVEQGRGLMPAALRLLLADLFAGTSLHRLEARCAVENVPSQKVLERLGFVREGLLRGYFDLRGRRVDNYLYALLRSDWRAQIGSSEA